MADEEIESVEEELKELQKGKELQSDIRPILDWLEKRRNNYQVEMEEVGVNQLRGWNIDQKTGNITHDTGKFYSIIGIHVKNAPDREVTSWDQPMIKQNECGILGLLRKRIDGAIHYLLQAKFEPGNVGTLQLSPTLQATHSNLKLYHKGKKPLFAEFFEEGKGKIISDVVSVEDPSRFYLKTNRNMIIEIEDDIDIPPNFIWVNYYQFKKLLKMENIVNTLVRSIMGGY
jgi:oxidase EvaA